MLILAFFDFLLLFLLISYQLNMDIIRLCDRVRYLFPPFIILIISECFCVIENVYFIWYAEELWGECHLFRDATSHQVLLNTIRKTVFISNCENISRNHDIQLITQIFFTNHSIKIFCFNCVGCIFAKKPIPLYHSVLFNHTSYPLYTFRK